MFFEMMGFGVFAGLESRREDFEEAFSHYFMLLIERDK